MSPEVNSLDWWDDFFVHQWEANRGREQTRHFMTRLVESLPPRAAARLGEPGTKILDWGCALGDGVDVLQHRFAGAVVEGYDFSEQAIQTARHSYPRHTFFDGRSPGWPRNYEAVVCSNCLEHFTDPLAILGEQLRLSASMHITLVPYAEHPLIYCHKVTLTENSFPARLGTFRRTTVEIVEVDPAFWGGRQMLVIYERQLDVWNRLRRLVGAPARGNRT